MNDLEFDSWIQIAQDDLKNVEVLLQQRLLPWIICFHCQQATEKYLKALQVVYLKNYQKEHDLVKIAKTLSDWIKIEDLYPDFIYLNGLYLADRYPTDRQTKVTIDQAAEVFEKTKKIIKVLEKYLPK